MTAADRPVSRQPMQNDQPKGAKIGLDNASTPDVGMYDMFLVQDNPFAFTPDQLSEMLNPKSRSAFSALGGLHGLEKGLHASRKMDYIAARNPSRMSADAESLLEDHCRPPAMTTSQEAHDRDHLPTARDTAKDTGHKPNGAVIEGPDFRHLDDADMADVLPRLPVLAHASPEDKHLLVQRLKSLGETVAVAGSGGGDDVPALGMADEGFSMGMAGTAVARAATQHIITDDSPSSFFAAPEGAEAINTAARWFLWLLPNVTAAWLYVSAVGSGDARRMLMAFLVWSCFCTEFLLCVSVSCRNLSEMVRSASGKYLGGLGTTRRRHMLKSESRFLKNRFSRDLRAGSRTPLADCLGQLGINVSWGASDWPEQRYHVNTLRTWHLPEAQPYNNNRVGHVLAWDQTALLNNTGLCCCCVGVGLAQMLPRNPRRLSLMVAVALLPVICPAAAAWTRAQTELALNVSVGAVAGISAVTVAVLRTKAQDLEPKWWISAYSCWAVAFVVAVVGALLKPSVVGRRKVFLCATLLLTANLNGCLGGQGSSAVDTILTLGPALLVVSLYLMTVLIDVWPDVIHATGGV